MQEGVELTCDVNALEMQVEVLLGLSKERVGRERDELVCGDAGDGDKSIRRERRRIPVIVKLIHCFSRDLLPLGRETSLRAATCCHSCSAIAVTVLLLTRSARESFLVGPFGSRVT